MTVRILALWTGFLIDLIFGDPVYAFHPIRLIGNLIGKSEKAIRKALPNNEKSELIGGFILWIWVAAVSFFVPFILLKCLYRVNFWLGFILESIFFWQIIAAKSLKTESMKVYKAFEEGDTEKARKAVSMIVGRDTASLTAEGITKAAVETVAENTSDGVTAPLIFAALFGASGGFLYKAVNTMDSMVGYKNDKYLYFGRFAAKCDDVFNFIPARITAYFMIISSFILDLDGKNAFKIFLRDRFNHASPNSAQTEAVCAGALDVMLAGDAYYFGKLYKKKTIGDNIRKIEPKDIKNANNLMYMTSVLILIVLSILLYIVG